MAADEGMERVAEVQAQRGGVDVVVHIDGVDAQRAPSFVYSMLLHALQGLGRDNVHCDGIKVRTSTDGTYLRLI